MERINIVTLNERAINVNKRLYGTGRAVVVEQRNGNVALDEYTVVPIADDDIGGRYGECVRTITVGTKREIADFLHAMIVGIDLSRTRREA